MHRRVVMTGIGVVSGLGVGTDAFWEGLLEGRSALTPIGAFDPAGFISRLAAEVADLCPRDHVPKSYRKAVKVMARDSSIAAVSAQLGVEQAGLATRVGGGEPSYPSDRLACHIGAGLLASDADEMGIAVADADDGTGEFSVRRWGEQGMGSLQPLWLLKYLPNMLACHVSIIHGCEGPSNTITCAEASGLLSIGESARVIERGDADVGLAGGAESKVNLSAMSRYSMTGRLASTGEASHGAALVRPYDPEASGQIIGEGGGIAVLESEAGAHERGASPIALIAGFGAAQSGPELSDVLPAPDRPCPERNAGLEAAMRAALSDARLGPEEIDAIVPQAAGHPSIDNPEAGALRAVFGERIRSIPLVTLGPMVGACWAGAGGLQVAAAALAIRDQRLPARIHAGSVPEDLDAGHAGSRPARIAHVLVCSSGIGGSNAALVLSRP